MKHVSFADVGDYVALLVYDRLVSTQYNTDAGY